ncbi:siderophore-interacting protein [Nocardioides sp. TF02-7]|uniref:siderophore-interacting protein n=1 Tax=Nocardioides sp. TF02-7 TaxID=2917724 RepID=UPI001F0566EC|nr:siderophore-interacting protein [Nocardioides sp. TF02-7]UMG91549.1 siderophore-interacting protein [Nocardioides sp. TF02-7]
MGSKPVTRLTVTDKERLTPGMVRLRFHGEDLSAFAGSVFTDRYVKLVFGDPAAIERGERPALRTYTALDPDPVAGTLAIDFVVHGDAGVAGPWAATAEPGDTINVRGPGGAYAPDATADWHLFAGDEAAVPAIRQSLAALPDDAEGYAVVQVDTAAHEQPLGAPAGVEVVWLHRSDPAHAGLADAVRALPWRDGRVHAFVHGEAQAVMHEIRPFLLHERGVPREDLSVSGYWRQGRTEEAFREWKAALAATEAAG